MVTATCRLRVLSCHLTASDNRQSRDPVLHVSPVEVYYDQPITVRISGLHPGQTVTIAAFIGRKENRFHSYATYRACQTGQVNVATDKSLAGTYTGIDPMGLLWSMVPVPGQEKGLKLTPRDANSPQQVVFEMYYGEINLELYPRPSAICKACIKRLFMSTTVRRIEVNDGEFRGTIFIPHGDGPFPAILDLQGGVQGPIDTRAALLANKGYATFSLTYMLIDHLPKEFHEIKFQYFVRAVKWFSRQSYVDANRIGAIGSSLGGTLVLYLAAVCSQIKAAININGAPFIYFTFEPPDQGFPTGWVDPSKITITEEGIVMKDVAAVDGGNFIPAWRHGAKLLEIVSEDDMMMNPSWHHSYRDVLPAQYRNNVEIHTYAKAGHFVEPPYGPSSRTFNGRRKAKRSLDKFSNKKNVSLFVCGGYPKEHSIAQEDSWNKIQTFLSKYV